MLAGAIRMLAVALVLGVGAVGLACLPGDRPAGAVLVALAASPTPSPAAGDTRSVGQGPGIVGSPLAAIAGVLGVGLVAAAATLLYVRLGGGRSARTERQESGSPSGPTGGFGGRSRRG